MTGLQTPSAVSPATNGNRNEETDPMSRFYAEVSSIQDGLSEFGSNVSRIGELHSRSLNSTDDIANRRTSAELEELVGKTRSLSNDLKDRIQSLTQYPVPRPQDARIRNNQIGLLRSKFVEILQNYQQVERDYRARYKQRVERQFKIVKPDATPAEVDAVVNNTEGGGDQIFAQALSNSTRYGESRAAYREVQDRHQDILKIERTLEELAQMFNDMSVLVQQQDESINAIDTTAAEVEENTKKGLEQTEKAVVHARRARRMRWICAIIVFICLAVVGIVVGVVVSNNVKNSHNS
ncbi:t-SNARE [Laetiporus sulphureus 93-53]|uniref:t-SNARE n=1 Tax=Laetiporus sulphureus 93-53 TaxID=1314785 RepID=A0A165H4Q4_9APHY|nr:t-SNARE [Laetiporus sulphureus 93-53]KZT11242.1 t-SNARE [Laetiporus sulphureus 93-53]